MKIPKKIFLSITILMFSGCMPFEAYEPQPKSNQVIIIPEAPTYNNHQLEHERQKNTYERHQNELDRQENAHQKAKNQYEKELNQYEREENELDRQINEYERQKIELDRIYLP